MYMLCCYLNNIMDTENLNILPELAPCGVYCGACPSYGKSCFGCPSEKSQKRKSKWSCNLRTCCYTVKNKNYCFECGQFPCEAFRKKLLDSHMGDSRFKYRHEVIENFKKLAELGIEQFIEYQNTKWLCSSCNGRIQWYYYKCNQCGKEY